MDQYKEHLTGINKEIVDEFRKTEDMYKRLLHEQDELINSIKKNEDIFKGVMRTMFKDLTKKDKEIKKLKKKLASVDTGADADVDANSKRSTDQLLQGVEDEMQKLKTSFEAQGKELAETREKLSQAESKAESVSVETNTGPVFEAVEIQVEDKKETKEMGVQVTLENPYEKRYTILSRDFQDLTVRYERKVKETEALEKELKDENLLRVEMGKRLEKLGKLDQERNQHLESRSKEVRDLKDLIGAQERKHEDDITDYKKEIEKLGKMLKNASYHIGKISEIVELRPKKRKLNNGAAAKTKPQTKE